MYNLYKCLTLRQYGLLILGYFLLLGIFLPFPNSEEALADVYIFYNQPGNVISQKTSLGSFSPISFELVKENKKIKVIVTAYSSTERQTDDTPFITASGSLVRPGIVANNMLAFGTKVKLPEIFGDRVFVVEDRLNWEKGKYHIDVWFETEKEAINFGAKLSEMEILN